MLELLEITAEDINELSDSDLRTLVALLCEAELEQKGLPVTSVKWGGDQRAADGGLDVFVDLENPVDLVNELPRWKTGIQVKQESMPESKVVKEMAPNNTPRAVLADLAQNDGAYIIACGRDSTSDKMLRSRLRGMKQACANVPASERLHLDFYDSSRIASWTRKHPGLIQWVRSRVGKPLSGWQSYDNWANCPGGITEEFLLDDSSKVFDGSSNITEGISTIEGLTRIRNRLAQEGGCVRLTGLSGVGKTRFTQALFDRRIGKNPLPHSAVCYTDISHEPVPSPRNLAVQLSQAKKRTVLVVDNCPPELHEELVKVCTQPGSKISLITIEYDIRDDRPEKTDVFHMEPSSDELIEKLIHSRYSAINRLEAKRIADFSEGNARIAIAIGDTVKDGETILTLQNNELFNRLFLQRNNADEGLTKAAEVCALVYSFDGENLGDPQHELEILASLCGLPPIDLYRHVTELCRRGLAQQRGKWRAILPHAIANRLAKQALTNYPTSLVEGTLKKDSSYRLIKSFSRRLGFLHDSEAAQKVATNWLRPEGLLGNTAQLNDLGIELFNNIAPIIPKKALEALERASLGPKGSEYTSRDNKHYSEITRLIRKIAYDADLFQRCCDLLLKFCTTEKEDENYNSIRELTASLFLPQLSGTCATVDQRLEVLADCLSEGSPNTSMALPILNKLLEAWHFSSHYSFEFGARPRGYGYLPKTWGDVTNWYSSVVAFTQAVILTKPTFSDDFKKCLANHFRAIWTKGRAEEALETATLAITEQSFWSDGWMAIRQTMNFDKKHLPEDSFDRLVVLERKLAPQNLYEQAKTYALSQRWGTLDIPDPKPEGDEDDVHSRYQRVAEYTEALGQKVSQDRSVFNKILPKLFVHDGNAFGFCKGLAMGCTNPTLIWEQLIEGFGSSPEKNRGTAALQGFLSGMFSRDKMWYESALDGALTNSILSPSFPYIQCCAEMNKKAVARLFKSLEADNAPIWQYKALAGGGQSCKIDDSTLSNLLDAISEKNNGAKISLDILSMRFYGEKEYPVSEELVGFGRKLCVTLCDEKLDRNDEHDLGRIVTRCYSGDSTAGEAIVLCQKIVSCLDDDTRYHHDFSGLVNSLIRVQPKVVLTELLQNYSDGERFFSWLFNFRESTILLASHEAVVEWCQNNPTERYPLISKITPLFSGSDDGQISSISPMAKILLSKANEFPNVLAEMDKSLYPSGWSGSLSSTLSLRIPFLEELVDHDHAIVGEWARKSLDSLLQAIDRERKREEKENKDRFEAFE